MADQIKVNLRADSGQLQAEFRKARGAVKGFGKDTTDSLKKLVAFGSGLLGLRAGLGVLEGLREQFDRIGKLSNRFDLPVETIQKLSLAAELTGSDIEKLVAGLTKATVAGQEAGQGLATYVRQFDALGISVAEFNQATPDQKLSILANAFRDAEDEATAFTAAYRILGKAGGELIPLLRGGAEGIEEITKNLNTLDAGQIAAIEKFNDQLTLLKSNLQAGLAGAFSEKDLDQLVQLITAFGQQVASVTKFLIKNGSALGDLAKVYVGYRVALKAVDFAGLIRGLTLSSTRFRTSTAAVAGETAALNANSAARKRNAASTVGGLGRAGGVLAGALALPTLFDLGQGIGNSLADSIFGDADEQMLKDQEEIARVMAQQNDLAEDRKQLDEVAIANAEFKRRTEQAALEANRQALEFRLQKEREMKDELRSLARDVIEVEVGFLAPEKQIARYEKVTADLVAAAERLGRRTGLQVGEGLTPGGAFGLAGQAERAGDLNAAKEFLKIAQDLREASEKRARLEEEIAQTKADQAERERALAAEQARTAEEQARTRRDLAVELKALQLEAAGRGSQAEALREEFDIRKEAARIAQETGTSEERALALLRERARLEKQIAEQRQQGESAGEIVARGSFKMQDGGVPQRLRGIPDIGFSGGIGNTMRRRSAEARDARDRARVKEANEERFFQGLLETSRSLLQIWEGLDAV